MPKESLAQQQSSRFYLYIHDVIRFERRYFVWHLQQLRVEYDGILNIPAILKTDKDTLVPHPRFG